MYRLLIGLVTPRPIAWVRNNLSARIPQPGPIFLFNGVAAANPPTLVFSVSTVRMAPHKDTLRNIAGDTEDSQSVRCPIPHAEQMNATAAELPYNESEFSPCAHQSGSVCSGSSAACCRGQSTDGMCAAPACSRRGRTAVGNAWRSVGLCPCTWKTACSIHRGDPDPQVLDHIGRMGGDGYCRIGDRFSIKRP